MLLELVCVLTLLLDHGHEVSFGPWTLGHSNAHDLTDIDPTSFECTLAPSNSLFLCSE